VAEYRAEENAAPDPLYRDSIIELFLNDATRQAAASALVASPSVKEGVKLRTRYLDDALEEGIARGCRQVVILGSGLDTRAVRKQATGVAYFELDDKATLDLKRARFAEHGIQTALTLIPANYVTDDWIALLAENGLDFDLPTHIIWVGAPWITGIDDVYALGEELGLDVIQNVLSADLHRWHWPTRPMSSSFLRFYSLCNPGNQIRICALNASEAAKAALCPETPRSVSKGIRCTRQPLVTTETKKNATASTQKTLLCQAARHSAPGFRLPSISTGVSTRILPSVCKPIRAGFSLSTSATVGTAITMTRSPKHA
jgi:Leucine carboxyl methyltransferase